MAKKTLPPVSRAAVMRTVYDLKGHDNGRDTWPTAARIAEHLRADPDDVLEHLRDLKRGRLFTDRQRRGERVWMPWNAT